MRRQHQTALVRRRTTVSLGLKMLEATTDDKQVSSPADYGHLVWSSKVAAEESQLQGITLRQERPEKRPFQLTILQSRGTSFRSRVKD